MDLLLGTSSGIAVDGFDSPLESGISEPEDDEHAENSKGTKHFSKLIL